MNNIFWRLLGFVVAFLVVAGASETVWASDRLNFDGQTSGRDRMMIYSYFEHELHEPAPDLAIARADLNEDGISEFFVQRKCLDANGCPYIILGESGDRIIKLGEIEAREVGLDGSYTHGVRNIIAFKNPLNDFDRAVYVWEPQSARYMIKE